MALIATVPLLKTRLSDTSGQFSDEKMIDLIDFMLAGVRRHCRTLVDLTVAANTTLVTLPEGYDFYLNDVVLEGHTAISGGTGSILTVGKSGAMNFVNETSGHTFTSATPATLIAANDRRSMAALYPMSNMNGYTVEKVAGGTALIATVAASTAVVTAGKVWVEVFGHLVPQG